jgi:hypothetical protein
MQKTLADVEISALNTSHVFGSSHLRALEDLRTAQLGLAQTWAKTEAEEGTEHGFDNQSRNVGDGAIDGQKFMPTLTPNVTLSPGPQRGPATKGPSPATGSPNTSKDTKSASAAFTTNKNLEEETERDIQLARQRREANDRYFSQVNKGVLEVVSKLDEVAGAMRRVERESREIWDEGDGESSEDGEGVADSGSEDADGDGREGHESEATGLTDSPLSIKKNG